MSKKKTERQQNVIFRTTQDPQIGFFSAWSDKITENFDLKQIKKQMDLHNLWKRTRSEIFYTTKQKTSKEQTLLSIKMTKTEIDEKYIFLDDPDAKLWSVSWNGPVMKLYSVTLSLWYKNIQKYKIWRRKEKCQIPCSQNLKQWQHNNEHKHR